LRALYTSAEFRRQGAGTFQISTVPGDWGLSSTFATSGLLVAGQVWSRVVAVRGQPAVRPMMTLTLSCDHGAWDGRAAGRLLAAVKGALEQA
jgi:pyruvate/2-oxoglutarate dehydrogenase complex dihydrolipoamide acyltransferase (E2) component